MLASSLRRADSTAASRRRGGGWLQLVVGCGVSVLAVILLLHQVPIDRVADTLAGARVGPLLIIVASVLGGLLTRAVRWGLYFRPGRRVGFGPLLGTLSISYLASTFLPFRAGELVRAIFLGQRTQQAIPRVVGTIVLEKLFDFLALAAMLGLLVVTTPLPPVARVVGTTIVSVILVGFSLVVALAIWRTPALRLLEGLESAVPGDLARRIGVARMAAQLAESIDCLRSPGLWPPLLGWTAAVWGMPILGAWAGLQALGIESSPAALLFLTVVTATGQAVPSSPGYVGVYHAAAVLALTTFGLDQASALGGAILIHVFTYGTLVVAGLVALWVGGYSIGDLTGVRIGPAGDTSGRAAGQAFRHEPRAGVKQTA